MSEEKDLFTNAMQEVLDHIDGDEYPPERMALHQYIDSTKAWIIDITVNAYSTGQNEAALACVERWARRLGRPAVAQEPAKTAGMWMQETRVDGHVLGLRACVRTRIPVKVKVEVVNTDPLT